MELISAQQYAIDSTVVAQTIHRAGAILDKYESFVRKQHFVDEDEDSTIQYKLEIAHYFYIRSLKQRAFKCFRENVDCPPEMHLAVAFYKFKLLARGFDSWRVYCFVQKRYKKLLKHVLSDWRNTVVQTISDKYSIAASFHARKLLRACVRAWHSCAITRDHTHRATLLAREHARRTILLRGFAWWRDYTQKQKRLHSIAPIVYTKYAQSLQRKMLTHWVQATISQLHRKRAVSLSGAHYKLGILEKAFVTWIKFVTCRKKKLLAEAIHKNKLFNKVIEIWRQKLNYKLSLRSSFRKWFLALKFRQLRQRREKRLLALVRGCFSVWRFLAHTQIYQRALSANARKHFAIVQKRKYLHIWKARVFHQTTKRKLREIADAKFRKSVCQSKLTNWRKQLRVVQCRKKFDVSLLESAFRCWAREYQVRMHARKYVLRQPFCAWRDILQRSNPARELRRKVMRANALRIKNFAFTLWHKRLQWHGFVSRVVRAYETARLRGLARVALRRWKRWAMRKAIGSEVFRFARGRIDSMKLRYVLHNWKLYVRESKRLQDIRVRADFLYHDKLMVSYFKRWKAHVRLMDVVRDIFAQWKNLKHTRSERAVQLNYLLDLSVVRLKNVKLRFAFSAWLKFHETKQEEKLLSDLYKRKLVKRAFFGWVGVQALHAEQTKNSFEQKRLVMEELLKFHYDEKLAQIHYLRTICWKYFKRWEDKALFLTRCAASYYDSNLKFVFFSKWLRKVKRVGETKQIRQYEQSAKTQKRGYLARHNRHVIYQKVGPKLSPQIEPKPAQAEPPALAMRTRMGMRSASPKMERVDTSSSADSRTSSRAGARQVMVLSPSTSLPGRSPNKDTKIEWNPSTDQILVVRSPGKRSVLHKDEIGEMPTPRAPPTPQQAPIFPKKDKNKNSNKNSHKNANLSASPQLASSPVPGSYAYRHGKCHLHGSDSPTKLQKTSKSNKLALIKHKVQSQAPSLDNKFEHPSFVISPPPAQHEDVPSFQNSPFMMTTIFNPSSSPSPSPSPSQPFPSSNFPISSPTPPPLPQPFSPHSPSPHIYASSFVSSPITDSL